MPRRTKEVLISADGRDKGKCFVVMEPPADQGERWANRLLFALVNAGTKLPAGSLDAGMAGLSQGLGQAFASRGASVLAGLHYSDVSGLLDEMMEHIQFQPSAPGVPLQRIYTGENSQIEEITTRWTLRLEWIQLTMGFLLAGVSSTSASNSETPPA